MPVPAIQEKVQQILDAATAEKDGVPGIVFGMMNRKGEILAEAASGVRGLNRPNEKMTTDTVFSLFSCTKILCTIAVMQLVEQGKVKLDDEVEKYLPEINEIRMVDGSVPKRKITLRMLLTHTAGFSYAFFNKDINDWSKKVGFDEFEGTWDGVKQPLIAQPGEDWNYGVNVDWAGKVLEAVTGETLGEYSRKNIFEPLGTKVIKYGAPPASVGDKFASLHQRDANGVRQRELMKFTYHSQFDSGGAGCVGTVEDYLKCIYILINEGKGANGARILKPETIDMMWQDQLTGTPAEEKKALSRTITAADPTLTNPVPPLPFTTAGWAMSAQLTKDPWPTGRSANSMWWAGLVNLFWMADREKGYVNMVLSQVLPFNDPHTLNPWLAAEGTVYALAGSS